MLPPHHLYEGFFWADISQFLSLQVQNLDTQKDFIFRVGTKDFLGKKMSQVV